ncbi:MAG: hypothetical protein WKF87_13000 [Chryseolinea sp.]
MNEPRTAFRKLVGRITFLLIVLHVSIAVISLLLPQDYAPLKLITFYRKYILIGPFFQDKRIRHSTHLFVAYHKDGKWSDARDYANDDFVYYTNHPWRYDKLHAGDYASYGASSLSTVKQSNIQASRAFRELNQYVNEVLIRQQVDSVSITYLKKHYLLEKGDFRLDTLFVHRYDPSKVDAGKTLD